MQREMTKQKCIVKLSLDDRKKRTKAIKTAVTMNGIVSVELDGDKLVVIGVGTDYVCLTTMLRKKLGYADLISQELLMGRIGSWGNNLFGCWLYFSSPQSISNGIGHVSHAKVEISQRIRTRSMGASLGVAMQIREAKDLVYFWKPTANSKIYRTKEKHAYYSYRTKFTGQQPTANSQHS